MRCADVERDLLEYAEGAVGRWRSGMMRVHLSKCAHCRKKLDSIREAGANLAGAMREPVSTPDVADSVMAAIRAEQPVRLRSRVGWAVAAVAASAVVVLAALCSMRAPESPRPVMAPIAKAPVNTPKPTLHKPSPPEAKPKEPAKPLNQPRPRRKQFRWPERHFASSQPAAPKPVPEKQPEQEQPIPEIQPSYIVVVTDVPVIEVRSTNSANGTVTTYSSRVNEDGRPQVIEVTYLPANPTMEGSEI